jgi:hypothetical protein
VISFEQIAVAFEEFGAIRQRGDILRGPCPAHGGRNKMALDIRRNSEGNILFHCFTHQCTWRQILDALGFVGVNLYSDEPESMAEKLMRKQQEMLKGYDNEILAVRAFLAFALTQRRKEVGRIERPATYADLDATMDKVSQLYAEIEQIEAAIDGIAEMSTKEIRRDYAQKVHRLIL